MNINVKKFPSVLQPFASNSNAKLLKVKDASKNVTLSLWNNQNDLVRYQNNGHHTLSLYFINGAGVKRMDKTIKKKSQENTICLMPKSQSSIWSITNPFQLAHMYFTDDYLKQIALETFDKDPREIFLQELSFENDLTLANILRYGVFQTDWQDGQNQHFIDHAIQMILLCLIQKYSNNNTPLPRVKGGLSPRNKTLVRDYIQDNLQQNIKLADLAQLSNLSEYHFARMFKLSFAITPHQYIQKSRIDKAAMQILTNMPLVDIAYSCGFSSQSHLGRAFKQIKGISPHKYKLAN